MYVCARVTYYGDALLIIVIAVHIRQGSLVLNETRLFIELQHPLVMATLC